MAKLPNKTKDRYNLRLLFARFNRLINGLLLAVILFSGYHFVLSPKFQQAAQGSLKNLNLAKAELAKRQTYFDQLTALVNNYNRISPTEIQKIKSILPHDKDIAGLLVQFQQLAAKNNLLLAAINFNDLPDTSSKDRSGIKKISINIDLIGGGKDSFEEIKDFVASLEINLRLFDIQSVLFKPDSASYSITLYAYYY